MEYNEDDIVRMLEFLTDIIFVELPGNIYKQTVEIPMEIYCAPLLVQLTKILTTIKSHILLGQRIPYLWHNSNVDSKKFKSY